MEQKLRRLTAAALSAVLLCLSGPAMAAAFSRPVSTAAAAQITVRFFANGGSGCPSPLSGEQGQSLTLPDAKVSAPSILKGLYFVGWSENSGASYPDYLPGEQVSFTESKNLYAVFSSTPAAYDPGTEKSPSVSAAPDSQPSFTIRTGKHTQYMSGTANGLFQPSRALTRAELAQMLCSIVVERPDAEDTNFSDVSNSGWYAPAVNAMAGLGILPGYSDGTFRPSQAVTRAESAAALAQLIPANGPMKTFQDVPTSHPNYDAICAVGGYGLFSGTGAGNFSPSSNFSRAEAAVVFNKLLGRTPDLNAVYSTSLRYFPDVPSDSWAYANVMEATTTHDHISSGSGEVWRDVQVDPVPLEDGYYRLNGRLYCVSNGQFLRSASKECFYFDAEGRYTTGDASLDAQLNLIVDQKIQDSMSRNEQLKALYYYCRDNYTYLKRPLVEVGATGWEPAYASQFLSTGKGNCYSYSALFCLLAREIGQPAYTVVGGLGKNASAHGWVEIKLDGTVYTFDPQLDWRYYYDHKIRKYTFFKILPQNAPLAYHKLSGGVPS